MIKDLSGINWPLLRARVRLLIMAARCRETGIVTSEITGGE